MNVTIHRVVMGVHVSTQTAPTNVSVLRVGWERTALLVTDLKFST